MKQIRYSIYFLIFLFLFNQLAVSMEPPRKGELEKYRKDGSLATRTAFAHQLKNHIVSPGLIQKKLAQFKSAKGGNQLDSLTPPGYVNLHSTGTQKLFALLIEFPDYPHTVDATVINSMLFGEGTSINYPYESLKNYYLRSSYGMLTIQGTTFGWYTASHSRSYYDDADAMLIEEALTHYDPTHDFSQYDNDHDGKIDQFIVFWTGPNTGWASFWWAWHSFMFSDYTFLVDGKTLGGYNWEWEDSSPSVCIHETGHALGLPDLYDYSEGVGPDGGVGWLDMMDGNWGDHNAFSKWLLDWLTPTVIGTPGIDTTITLRASSQYPDAVAIMPGITTSYPFQEFYLVQNRSRIQNDFDIPTDGLTIWHIDATLGTSDFGYNNSYSSHKLVRLMEADGLEHIENYYNTKVDSADFYIQGKTFSTYSFPSSLDYAGNTTGATVQDISTGDTTRSVHFLLYPSNYNLQLSGLIQDPNSNPMKNIPMRLTGYSARSTATDTTGQYTFPYLCNGTYTVSPNRDGYRFIPTSRTVSPLTANTTNQNFVRKFGIDSKDVTFLGRTNGAHHTSAIRGNYAYVAEGGGLAILQISNNTSLQLVNSVPLADEAQSIALSGNYAYVADYLGGLYIFDISSSTTATVIGHYYTDGPLKDVTVVGNYAYVVDEWYGLRIFDVSDPTSPFQVGRYQTPALTYAVAIDGNYAYIAGGPQGLIILNISTTSNPFFVGQYFTTYNAVDVAISSTFAYVPDEMGGLEVINVSNPANPTLAGDYAIYLSTCVTISSTYAYLGTQYYGMQVINISNPANPYGIGTCNTLSAVNGITKNGSYVYLADGYTGLRVVDVSSTTRPVEKGYYNPPGAACGVAISGSYAYIAEQDDGLRVHNISNPANPVEVGHYAMGGFGSVKDVAINSTYAFLADEWNGLVVLNISVPSNPTYLTNYYTPGTPEGIAINGTHAYIADKYAGLTVMDISNPSSPYMVGTCATPADAIDIAVQGSYAYIATDTAGLRIINISNASSPIEVGSYSALELTHAVAVNGNYAYVAADTAGLRIINISTASSSVEVGSYVTLGAAKGVTVYNNFACVADETYGLRVINVSNPASPSEAAYYDNPGSLNSMAVVGSNIYAAIDDGGLWILNYTSLPVELSSFAAE